MKRIYLICPVRNASDQAEAQAYVAKLEAHGNTVHYPPRDVDQSDPSGSEICRQHLAAMTVAHEVHVLWDVESKGSHFDLGMAYALGRPIVPVRNLRPEPAGKTYWKAVISEGYCQHGVDMNKRGCRQCEHGSEL